MPFGACASAAIATRRVNDSLRKLPTITATDIDLVMITPLVCHLFGYVNAVQVVHLQVLAVSLVDIFFLFVAFSVVYTFITLLALLASPIRYAKRIASACLRGPR